MQSNLHRVSEFAVLAEHKIGDDADRSEATASIKRLRENDGDSESEIDEIAVSDKSTLLPDIRNEGNAVSDHLLDSHKAEGAEVDTTVFLSFDWENEAPYEKAVERYYGSHVQILSIYLKVLLLYFQFSFIYYHNNVAWFFWQSQMPCMFTSEFISQKGHNL